MPYVQMSPEHLAADIYCVYATHALTGGNTVSHTLEAQRWISGIRDHNISDFTAVHMPKAKQVADEFIRSVGPAHYEWVEYTADAEATRDRQAEAAYNDVIELERTKAILADRVKAQEHTEDMLRKAKEAMLEAEEESDTAFKRLTACEKAYQHACDKVHDARLAVQPKRDS